MTERFRLAANVLLKRRLNNLVRIDSNVEIDRDFITCAEYQLFIDEMRQHGKNPRPRRVKHRQPDHWTSEKFPPGDAKKPIIGVRASDAEEFCEWLTKKETLSGFKYRLPNIAESKEISATIKDLGCWCKDSDTFTISGITAQKWHSWQQQFSDYLIFKDSFIFYRDINRELYRDLYEDLYRDLYRDRNRDLLLFFNYNDYPDDPNEYPDDPNEYLFLSDYVYLFLNHNDYRDINQDPFFDQERNLFLFLNKHLYRDLVLTEHLDLDLYRDLYREIESGQASNLLLIYLPLIFPLFVYLSLEIIYGEAAQDRKIRIKKYISLSRQKYTQKSQEYAQKKDKIFRLYAYLVLMDQRQKGNMPAWEGIRIVREREEID